MGEMNWSDIKAYDIFDYENLISMSFTSRTLFDALLELLIEKGSSHSVKVPLKTYASNFGITRKKDIEKWANADADFLKGLELKLKAGRKRVSIKPFYEVNVENDHIFFGFDLAFLVAIEKYLQKAKREA